MQKRHYDLAVIGSGPGGEGAAMRARKGGMQVAMVEKSPQVGGTCTHTATIPTKALRYAVRQLADLRSNPLFRALPAGQLPGFPEMLGAASTVISRQVEMRRGFYDRNGIDLVHGRARFLDSHTLEVAVAGRPAVQLSADHFVIATGSRPYHPPDVDFGHPRVRDAETILQLTETPQSITIYGAGVGGCEYASILRTLGVKVNLVNTFGKLLSFLDDEIVDALAYHLRTEGVMIRHNEQLGHVECADDHVMLHLESGKRIRSDVLLWTNGRTGNTQDLGLEELGIATDSRGNVEVNDTLQTEQSHIYAVGDVAGPPALASVAYDEGRFVARHMQDDVTARNLLHDVPTGIYTSPEISSVGRTEAELTSAKIPYEVGHSDFRNLARAQITGRTTGMLKILFHRETFEVLGVHCFGYQAAEIVHIGQAVMAQEGPANSLMYFVNTTFNYPTMAEAYRVAALNGLNRVS